MRSSRPIRRALSSVAIALALGTSACSRRAPAEGPIIIYVVDALRPDRMSLYGNPRPTTPAAEALAREGVTYTNAFALSTWTRPSVATMLTSLFPSQAGALNRWGRLDESVPYLPELLRRKGWKTAAFVSNGNLFDDRLGFRRGLDLFHVVTHAPTGEWHATAREVMEPVLKFVAAQTSPRFFVYIHVVDPHAPFIVEEPYRSLFSDEASPKTGVPIDYDRSARQADDQFHRLSEALRAKGFWPRATIVYTADHGEEFGEHGGSTHGSSIHDEQLRVPLVIRYPGGEDGGSRRPDPVSLADVTPTVADLCGLSASRDWIGASLWRQRLPAEREVYATEDLDEHRLYGLRRGRMKLIVRLYPTFSRTLYDLESDPGEKAGIDLPCGAATGLDRGLGKALAAWRERDIAAFTSLRFDAGESRRDCRAVIDLSTIAKPLLTADDHCEWSAKVQGARLEFRPASSARRLTVSTDDNGRVPAVWFAVSGASCVPVAVPARFMTGPITEEHLERLRALGYLGGPR